MTLHFKATFTPRLLRRDIDPGPGCGAQIRSPMALPIATRDAIQAMIGRGWTEGDFATFLLRQEQASGVMLKSEDMEVGDGVS